jgi:hypothetical protein
MINIKYPLLRSRKEKERPPDCSAWQSQKERIRKNSPPKHRQNQTNYTPKNTIRPPHKNALKRIGIRGRRKSGETPLLIRGCSAFQVDVDNFFENKYPN